MICKICANSEENGILLVREIYFGSEEAFKYLECSACGGVQIIDSPSDMESAYPLDYDPFKREKYREDSNFFKSALGKKRIFTRCLRKELRGD